MLLFFMVCIYVFVALGQKRINSRLHQDLDEKSLELKEMKNSKLERMEELTRWIKAVEDIEELKESYIYSGDDSLSQIRKELDGLFKKARVKIFNIGYDYNEIENQKTERIVISLDVEGTYPSIKKFFHLVETNKKMLFVQKLAFTGIDETQGRIRVKITMVGYYEY